MTTAPPAPSHDFLPDPLLNLTQRKGRYGVVYLRALAGQVGCGIEETPPGEDVQAIDADVKFQAGSVAVQVKTTHKHAIDGKNAEIHFTPHVDWLRKWGKLKVPVYFVVVVVPDDSGQWLDHHAVGTQMNRTAAYWCRIDVTTVTSANKIVVPRSQRLSAETLIAWENDLLDCFKAGA
ncbi:DUF4365 domain-containing protein [Rathayibacter agropyri]|uniref:DUF4365 domain-containing protein n=1 Tax=Rathayibacter agropyri TaxID=1634927 RepID=UPI0015674536|nr:DUF4365 domain-containing protein [Rathayibacter agropyri]